MLAGVGRACALYLPHHIAAEVKVQLPAGAIVLDFVFDVLLRDRLIASDAYVPLAIASADAVRYATRQLAVMNSLFNAQLQFAIW